MDLIIDIFFDGACMSGGQKKGETGLGIAVYIDKEYSERFSSFKKGDIGSNNIAEWCAAIEALKVATYIAELCLEPDMLGIKPIISIFGDSQLIVNQFNGNFEVRHHSFVKYFSEAKEIALQLSKATYFKYLKWVPREKNKQADRLSKMALGKKTTLNDILTI